MAKIKMTQTIAGCMDGIHPKKYVAEEIYAIDGTEINQRLADMFLGCGAAVIIRERKPILESPEKAVVEEAPEAKLQSPELKPEIDLKEETKHEPKTIRVFQLADKLGVSYKKILYVANDLGIEVKVAQSGLTEAECKRIESSLDK